MSIELIGVNHRCAPLALRERLAAMGGRAASAAIASAGRAELVVLSTCNRFEIYAPAGRAEAGPRPGLLELLDGLGGGAGSASPHAYRLRGREAAAHLFRVAAGLDSLVLGESEILGQVRSAYEAARDAGRTEKRMNVLFQRALFVGKAVRSRTGLGQGQVSVASVAVELARRIFGSLEASTVLVLGAGEMAEKTARHFLAAKAGSLYLANRTWEKARALCAELGARTVHWDDFPAKLSEVDVVVASTGSPVPVLTRALVASALDRRGGRSLFLIDIAMPRDVSEEVDSLDGVFRYGLEDLRGVVAENAARRRGEIAAAEGIILREADAFGNWLASVDAGRELSLRHSERPRSEAGRAFADPAPSLPAPSQA